MDELNYNTYNKSSDKRFSLKNSREVTLYTSGAISNFARFILVIGIITCTIILFIIIIMLPPRDFPVKSIFYIDEGKSLIEVANDLKDNNFIRSSILISILIKISGNADHVQAGDYIFEKPLPLFTIASRITEGRYGDIFVRVTLPEGSTLKQMSDILANNIKEFNSDYFLEKATQYNGYLFPNTYFFFPRVEEGVIIEKMQNEFSKQLREIIPERIADITPEDLRKYIIMASILEREANSKEDIYVISGILWKRIEKGMPLQVDASFNYLFNKSSDQVTQSDMEYDSPYNTYKYKGLPPGPLGNPGALSIDASFHPAASPYIYYLHDADGVAHFAKALSEHVRNKREYLK